MHKKAGLIAVVGLLSLVMLLTAGYLLNSRSGSFGTALAAPLANPPDVQQVDPGAVVNTADASITVAGADFARVLSGTEVISLPTVLLDGDALADVGWVSSATLTSTVPAGYPVGSTT